MKADQQWSAGRASEAETLYRSFLKLNPAHVGATRALGIVCSHLKKLDESDRLLERAVRIQPDAMAYYALGCNAGSSGRDEAAVEYYDKALALAPTAFEAHSNRASALYRLGRHEEALAACNAAIALKPDGALAWYNRGLILYRLRQYPDALTSLERAVVLAPDYADALHSLGAVRLELGQYHPALALFEKAVALSPTFAEAHKAIGIVRLLLGQFEDGWKEVEWRWQTPDLRHKVVPPCPLWLGSSSPAGKTIVLYAEQGAGDTIQFCRYVPFVESLGATVILAVQRSVVPVLRSLRAKCTVLPDDGSLPWADLRCPLLSLPLAFGTRADTIPATERYLYTEPRRQQIWRTQLGHKTGLRIGLAWSGAPSHANDHNRSIPLKTLAPLFELKCAFHSLQKEYRNGDLNLLAGAKILTHHSCLSDFADTASLITEMDLVVSVDTSVAHLAGALGKPVWILLPHVPDWRWLTEREDSPWYPTARLFRQRSTGDWSEVIARVRRELENLSREQGRLIQ